MTSVLESQREITVLGYTKLTEDAKWFIGDKYASAGVGAVTLGENLDTNVALPVFAGRVCYQAFGMRNLQTSTPGGYMRNIISQNHGSVLEHVSVSFHVSGVSRALSHELVRHRHFSYSQESQRYVTGSGSHRYVVPPALRDHPDLMTQLRENVEAACGLADALFTRLRDEGLGKKQAAEAARAVLPNCHATSLVFTGNLRSLMEFVTKRDHAAADAEMQEFAHDIYQLCDDLFPEVFGVRALWDASSQQKGSNYDKS